MSITSPNTMHFAGAENVGRPPVKSAPIDAQPQIALLLRGESANRRPVEGQVVPALDEQLLVVIEHVQAAFQIAEQNGHGFDAFLVREVFQAFFLNLADRNALHALFLGVQVQFFQFAVRQVEKVLQFSSH